MTIKAVTSESNRCAATTKAGQPCRAAALPGDRFCFSHSPATAEARESARRKGGRNSAKIVRLRGLIPPRLLGVYDLLEQALEEVHEGSLPASRATAMASVARAMVSVLTAGEMEERLRRIEQEIEGRVDHAA